MQNTSPDTLRLVGTIVLLARSIDQERRTNSEQDLDLNGLFVLRSIQSGTELPSQVARKLRVDPPRITRIADDLVKRGFVQRKDDPTDRRRCRLHVTPAGKRAAEAGLRDLSAAAENVLRRMGPTDRELLFDSLEAARTVLDQEDKV